jgi:hypothetical protein
MSHFVQPQFAHSHAGAQRLLNAFSYLKFLLVRGQA